MSGRGQKNPSGTSESNIAKRLESANGCVLFGQTRTDLDSKIKDFVLWAQKQLHVDPKAAGYHELEFTWLPTDLQLFTKIPMTLEASLAQSVFRARDQEVVPFEDLYLYGLSDWVTNAFLEAGRRPISYDDERGPRSQFASDSDFDSFRNGTDFRYGFADVRDAELGAVLKAVLNHVTRQLDSSVVDLGSVARVLAFPMGRTTIRQIPLVDDTWIDERLLELIALWRLLRAEGYVCLPAIDPHPAAFERVFPRETRWPDHAIELKSRTPDELDEHSFEELWSKARKHVGNLRGSRRSIEGLMYVDLSDADLANDPYLVHAVSVGSRDLSHTGVRVENWNQWVAVRKPMVRSGGIKVPIGVLQHSGVFPGRNEVLAIDGSSGTQQYRLARSQLIRRLIERAREDKRHRFLSAAGIDRPSQGERRIVCALYRRVMGAEELADAVHCKRRTVFGKGWLKRLIDHNVVVNDRRVGGYFLPQFPPPQKEAIVRALVLRGLSHDAH